MTTALPPSDVTNPASPATTSAQATAAARERKAVDLRLAGWTYSKIAEEMGWSDASTARRAIQRRLDVDYPPEQVTVLRQREVARLERIRLALWPAVLRGDVQAISSAIRLSERLARMQGLDAPVRVEVSSEVDEQIKALAASLEVPAEQTPDGAYVVTGAER